MRRVLAATIVTLALITGACGAPEPTPVYVGPSVSLPVRERLGIAHGLRAGAGAERSAARAEVLRHLAWAGYAWSRIDFVWDQVERERGVFDFSAYDPMVDQALGAGHRILALLVYGNTLYSERGAQLGNSHVPPDDPADFARFAGAAAAHFAGRLTHYEIWNEPNVGVSFWVGTRGGDYLAYGTLAAAASAAIRAADPAARVVLGGVFDPKLLGSSGYAFLHAAHEARPDLPSAYDAFAFHPYRYPFNAPELRGYRQRSYFEVVERYWGLAAEFGAEDRALWNTEFGWHTAPKSPLFPGVSYLDQARFTARGILGDLAAGIERTIEYNYADGRLDPDFQEDAFGILEFDPDPADAVPGNKKRVFRAHQVLAAVLGPTTFDRDLCAGACAPGTYGLRFTGGGRAVQAWWTVEGTVARAIADTATGSAELITMDGGRTPLAGPAATVALTPSLVYLVVREDDDLDSDGIADA
ncbi:MAG: hypothetical protein KC466_11555, partial [Myxococcales bacterium]|nr:hypothetical protein [Myxococcales bacterium]